jgi:hypothetical protein
MIYLQIAIGVFTMIGIYTTVTYIVLRAVEYAR